MLDDAGLGTMIVLLLLQAASCSTSTVSPGAGAATAVATDLDVRDPCTIDSAPAGRPLSAVQHEVRAVLASSANCAKVRVRLSRGVYQIVEPLRFNAADSGTAATPVVWSAAAGALVSGGTVVTGWRKVGQGPLWQATLPGAGRPHQLFVGGERRVRARTPNAGQYFAIASMLGNASESDGVVFANGSLAAVADTAGVEAVVYASYFTQRYPVAALSNTTAGPTVTFPAAVPTPKYAIYKGKHGSQSRAYLENAFEFLDAPGACSEHGGGTIIVPHPTLFHIGNRDG